MKKSLLLLGLLSSVSFAQQQKDYSKQVDSLMQLMTIEEKIGQTVQFSGGWDVTGPTVSDVNEDLVKQGQIGSFLNLVTAKATKDIQKLAVEGTRLGIPLLIGYDVIHGYKTIFPINLGLSSSWNPQLVQLTAEKAALEAAAEGIHWTFSPMVDIARDPRWGRISEGSGEDVYLGIKMAEAYVRGYQGDDLSLPTTIAACMKHYIGYGAALAGRDYNTVDMGDNELRNTYLPPFKAGIDAGARTLMTSFNVINDVPASGNKYTLKDILRDEWGFEGLVVSDYTSINEMIPHGYAADGKDAAQKSFSATLDMDMMGDLYRSHLKELIEEGALSIELLDDSVRRILTLKFELGLFEDPYRYSDLDREAETIYRSDILEAAVEAARQSIVLLQNNKAVLPLKTSNIALIGPLADDQSSIIGDWAAKGDRKGKAISVQEGLSELLQLPNLKVVQGTKIETSDTSGFKAALKAAKKAEAIVMVLGEDSNMSGEAASRSSINLPGNQSDLLAEIRMQNPNKPLVLVLMNGRPLDITEEVNNADAVLEAWFPGTMGGQAIAEIIYGKTNPSAKLAISFPVNVGQVPVFYSNKTTGRPMNPKNPKGDYRSFYQDIPNKPLFSFGYGLSYSKFEYSNVTLDKKVENGVEVLDFSVSVKNTSKIDGYEIVQLYIQDVAASITRPAKELKGFEKVWIKAGEEQTVRFKLSREDLGFWNQGEFKVEAGTFKFNIAPNSDADLTNSFILE